MKFGFMAPNRREPLQIYGFIPFGIFGPRFFVHAQAKRCIRPYIHPSAKDGLPPYLGVSPRKGMKIIIKLINFDTQSTRIFTTNKPIKK